MIEIQLSWDCVIIKVSESYQTCFHESPIPNSEKFNKGTFVMSILNVGITIVPLFFSDFLLDKKSQKAAIVIRETHVMNRKISEFLK